MKASCEGAPVPLYCQRHVCAESRPSRYIASGLKLDSISGRMRACQSMADFPDRRINAPWIERRGALVVLLA